MLPPMAALKMTCSFGLRSCLVDGVCMNALVAREAKQDWHAAGKELRRWVYGGGKVLPGLVTRREAEVALLL